MLRIAARIVGPARGHTGPYTARGEPRGPSAVDRIQRGVVYTRGTRGEREGLSLSLSLLRLDNNHIHRETHNANRKDAAYYAGMSTEVGSRGSSKGGRGGLSSFFRQRVPRVCWRERVPSLFHRVPFESPSNRETLAALSRVRRNLFRL